MDYGLIERIFFLSIRKLSKLDPRVCEIGKDLDNNLHLIV